MRTKSLEGNGEEPKVRLKLQMSRINASGFQVGLSVNKYGASLFAPFSFFVEGSSSIGAASAIISHSPFRHMSGL